MTGKEKTIFVHLSETYAPLNGFEFDDDKNKVFGNIFYYISK
jgi:hypothetical protein